MHRHRLLFLIAGILPLGAMPPAFANRLTPDYSDPATAINEPDKYAWQLFAALNQTDPDYPKNALWESWIEQEDIYANPKVAPVWDVSRNRRAPLHANLLLDLEGAKAGNDPFHGAPAPFIADATQEVRVNRAGFDYVVAKELWYQEGVLKAAMLDAIHFPRASKLVKSTWVPIKESDKPRYHWQVYGGKLLGLVALGIVTKDLPMWYWSTFEHIDNPGRSDVTGSLDAFGVTPSYQAPHKLINQGYPPGELTPELQRLFAENHIAEEWKNYRLKGTQVAFADAMGRPTVLGSSIQEAGQVATSSCMTCHARASIAPGVNFAEKPGPVANQSPDPFKSLKPALGFVGPPDPNWFFQSHAGPPAGELQLVYPVDFLWELPLLPKMREGWVGPVPSGAP